MRRLVVGLLALASLTAPAVTRAATFVLDASTGAVYDSVGDGWFFAGPTQPPPDGVGDAGGQALAIGYIAGVLELRAMAEFPLAPLSGVAAAQVQSATVTITIDDVLSTFGPGANFDGTASSPFAVYHYPANGTVTVGDFSPAGLVQLGIVSPGAVTDASLAVSGALGFTVDATQKVKDALTAGDVAFGVLLGTLDSPTGTSLDDLAPPGVAGGKKPFLTIVTAPLTPPVFGSSAQGCQAVLAKESGKVTATALKSFATCFGAVLKDWAPDAALGASTAPKCAKGLAPGDATSKLGKALAKYDANVAKKCADVVPTDIGSPCNGTATTIAQTASCLRDAALEAAESLVRTQYTSACTLLVSVGLDGSFPGVCTP